MHISVAIGRTYKFAYAEWCLKATRATAREFLEYLIAAVPYAIHTILTDNGSQFTNRKKYILAFMTPFDRVATLTGLSTG